MKRNAKKNKGITLIALVITIIVLLILAGVTIASLSGDNGILTRAAEAKEQTKKADAEEQIKLGLTEVLMNSNLGKGTLETLLNNKFGSGNVTSNPDGSFTITQDGYQVKVDSKGTIIESEIDGGGNQKPAGGIAGTDGTNANAPVLPKNVNFEYVTWNGETEKTSPTKPENWYNYAEGKWANIKTTYNGKIAYWVWIPRYEYIVPAGNGSAGPKQIEVKFTQSTKVSSPEYTMHPAFKFGDDELPGIWVAKFEASGSIGAVNVVPGQPSLRSQAVSSMFTACRNMQKDGTLSNNGALNQQVDGHMMKNMEWGAVAILSQSTYGIFNTTTPTPNNEVWINNNQNYTTGSAGASVSAASTTSATSYNIGNGPKASTTGNVYGIYDMSGGAWEYVMGLLSDSSNNIIPASTGFQADQFSNPKNGNYIAPKYYDVYKNEGNVINDYKGADRPGNAIFETKGAINNYKTWNGDCAYFPTSSSPVFGRGGSYNNGASAGVFCFYGNNGSASSHASFRPVFVAL